MFEVMNKVLRMRRRAPLVLWLAPLILMAACTTYEVPTSGDLELDAEIAKQESMQKALESKHLTQIKRVRDRLYTGAALICAQVGFEPCEFQVRYVRDGHLNAYATYEDGKATLLITTGMMEFLETDERVAVVIGHEMGHIIADHIDKSRMAAGVGAALGAILDVLLGGGGTATQMGAEIGYGAMSADYEREADYLGVYIAYLSDYDIKETPGVWREMGVLHPLSIAVTTTHPATAERFVNLNLALREIADKANKGQPVLPTLQEETVTQVKGDNNGPADR